MSTLTTPAARVEAFLDVWSAAPDRPELIERIWAERGYPLNAGDLRALLAERNQILDLVADLTDEGPCRFDHHGGCQAHGYLELDGQRCPHAEAKELLAAEERPESAGT